MSGFRFSTQVVLIFSCPQENSELVASQKEEIMWPLLTTSVKSSFPRFLVGKRSRTESDAHSTLKKNVVQFLHDFTFSPTTLSFFLISNFNALSYPLGRLRIFAGGPYFPDGGVADRHAPCELVMGTCVS
jgi:hypothetical protein